MFQGVGWTWYSSGILSKLSFFRIQIFVEPCVRFTLIKKLTDHLKQKCAAGILMVQQKNLSAFSQIFPRRTDKEDIR